MIELQEIFDIKYGHGLSLNKLGKNPQGVNFVSRQSKNNGVSVKVNILPEIKPYESGMITVALGGSVLEAFVQPEQFYTAYHIFCLSEKETLTLAQKLYYCACIRTNKYRYSYGRQANKTLKTLLIPSIDEIPAWVNNLDILKYENAQGSLLKIESPKLNFKNWKYFAFSEIFSIKKGFFNKKPPTSQNKNDIPFIGASEQNNGVTGYVSLSDMNHFKRNGDIEEQDGSAAEKIFLPNAITVVNNGSVAETFYQKREFTCTHDVNPLYVKGNKMNVYVALFLATLIRNEKYRWSYGRKWRPIRMEKSKIKLPVDDSGNPDWQFMENYIKSLPYSSNL